MLNYLKESFRRKRARRVTREYPAQIQEHILENDGKVAFANWTNPLSNPVKLEQNTINFFRKFIKQGDFAIDIGANIGDTTVPMALAAGKSGLVLGFDPNPFVFKILEENAKLNPDKMNIVALPYAISVEEEEFFFVSSEASFANGGISESPNSQHGKYVYEAKVKGINLKQLLQKDYKNWLSKLSFIKIDTEGYDKEILKSISGILSERKPSIVAESFGSNSDDEKMELFEVIFKHGYDIYQFDDFNPEAEALKLQSSKEMLKWKKTTNIYAVPN